MTVQKGVKTRCGSSEAIARIDDEKGGMREDERGKDTGVARHVERTAADESIMEEPANSEVRCEAHEWARWTHCAQQSEMHAQSIRVNGCVMPAKMVAIYKFRVF